MLERNEGARGGTGVAKTLARSITIRFKEPPYSSNCTEDDLNSDITTAKLQHLCLTPGTNSRDTTTHLHTISTPQNLTNSTCKYS